MVYSRKLMTNKFFLKYFIINYLLNFLYRNTSVSEKSLNKKSFNENFSLQEIYNNNKTNVKILWLCPCNKLHTGTYLHVWLRMHVQSLVSQGTLWITCGRIPSKIKWRIHDYFILYFKFWRYYLFIYFIFMSLL